MSRREFLEVLRGQLSGQMTQGRAAAHVRYYEDYIQSQVRNGRSESDVLAELGDPRLIAKTLIDTDDSAAVYDESGILKRATVQMIMRIMGRRAVPERQEALNWI